MTWYIYDADGYVGDAGTNTGWAALCDYFEASGNEDAAFLAEEGWSEGIDFTTIPVPEDPDLAATFLNLMDLAVKCKEILIVSQGFEEGEGEGEPGTDEDDDEDDDED